MMYHQRVMCLLVLALVLCHGLCTKEDITVCITNCGQCKQMFGSYFRGSECAESCISSNGKLLPDCNNPSSMLNFLKMLR